MTDIVEQPSDVVPVVEPVVEPPVEDLMMNAIKRLEATQAIILERLNEPANSSGIAMIARLGESVDQLEASLKKDSVVVSTAPTPTYCVLNPYFRPT